MQRLTGAEWRDDEGGRLYAYEYGYDKVGNRVSLVYNGEVTYYSYNPANELTHEVTLGGETVYYSYDGRGNQTERRVLGGDTLYFEYDSRNLITRIDSTEAGFTPNTFAYNALGQRIRKTDSTGTTYYVWDGLNITHEHDGSGAVTRRYTHGHTPIHGVFSLIDVQDVAAAAHYCYHLDQVGGVHRLTDAAQAIAQTLEFSPYGRTLEEAGSAPNPFGFPGTYLMLPDLQGYSVSLVRLFTAGLGRFMSRDPRDRLEGPNLYTYLTGDPQQSVDPSGSAAAQEDPTKAATNCFYKCGVESFVVKWTTYPERGGKSAGFYITVAIRFKDDAQHAPYCCEFRQWVQYDVTYKMKMESAGQRTRWKTTRHSIEWVEEPYRRGLPWDIDKKPWLHDPGFVTTDAPGWTETTTGKRELMEINPDDELDYRVILAQYVRGAEEDYEFSAGRSCAKQGFIQRVGPHTGTIKGKHPRKFGGAPWTGTGRAFTGKPEQDATPPRWLIPGGDKK